MFPFSIAEETSSARTVADVRTIRSIRRIFPAGLRFGLILGSIFMLVLGLTLGWTKGGVAQGVTFSGRAFLKAMASKGVGGGAPTSKSPVSRTEATPTRGRRPQALPVNPITGNLLANPGAELGSIADWTPSGPGGPPQVDSGTLDPGINPHTGSYDFTGYTGSADSLSQTVSLLAQGLTAANLDSGTLAASVSFWEQGRNEGASSDNGAVMLTFLDASNATITTVNSGMLDNHGGTWGNFYANYSIPVGTRSITYTMHFTREVGTSLDAFIDDNDLFITTDTGLTLSTDSVHFGNVAVGTTSAAQVVTVLNAQTTTINISQVQSQLGANPSDFVQENDCIGALAPGATCGIAITFKPGGVGPKSAGIVITDDSSLPQQQIMVDGTGTGGILQVNPGSLKTLAGNGTLGYSGDGGAAAAAELTQPNGVAFDPSGNLYIADDQANVVRKVNTAGNITTFAGNGAAGYTGDGGAATAAELSGPDSVTSDALGNIYIQDTLNNVIRKVDSDGTITTFAGTGAQGHAGDGGPATAARFNQNQGARFDSAGNLFVPQCGGSAIRKIDTAGNISTVAGNYTLGPGFSGDDGPATSAQLNCPSGVTIDPAGNFYIADEFNQVIRKVTAAGVISTVAGTPTTSGFSGDGGPATSATLNLPNDVVLDATGNLYVADSGNNRVRKIDTSGVMTTVAGGLNNAGSAGVNTPLGVTVDAAGNVYFSDSGNGKVQEIFPEGTTPFPATVVGATAAAQTLTISNIGNVGVTIPAGSFTKSGNAGDFALTGGTCLAGGGVTLAAGGACTLTISFTPTAVGVRAVTVSIADNALNSPQSFVVSGTGTPATPAITWATPANVVYGTALGPPQLNAVATGVGGAVVAGTFAYTPAAGTVLGVGTHTLSVLFTPTDPNYVANEAVVPITVTQATPVLTWATPAAITVGTALSATQLNAVATDINGAAVPGVYTYTPGAGTLLPLGTQTLSVTFAPTDTVDFAAPAAKTVSISVVKVAPVATTTTLAVTSGAAAGGAPVTTVAAGTVVTLTATVATVGGAVMNPGQVAFCDATAVTCTDIHLLGTAQVTTAGTATYRFVPGIGAHSYKAVFLGTGTTLGSASGVAALAVAGTYPTTTTIAQSGAAGNYTLTATTTSANGANVAPTGTVSFLDSSNGNAVLGTGVLGAGTETLGFAAPAPPAANYGVPALADFNGDGVIDLAVVDGKTISLFLGNGDGSFRPGTVITSAQVPFYIAAGDFNNDGKVDFVVSDIFQATPQLKGRATVFLGNGDGTFAMGATFVAATTNADYISVGDFNGDGTLDLVVSDENSNLINFFLGNGDGTFRAGSTFTGGTSPYASVVGDFNGDGKPDVAITSAYGSSLSVPGNSVIVLLGNGDGSFTAAPSPTVGSTPAGIAVGDFNGDGKLDLAVSNSADNNVTILAGNGDGTFASLGTVPTDAYPQPIFAGDFNADGKTDFAVASYTGNVIDILLGNGDGTFTAASTPSTGIGPIFLAVGDLNGDGTTDVVSGNVGRTDFSMTPVNTSTVLLAQVTQAATATATGVAPLGLGTHEAVASYPGDANYGTSVSAATGLTGVQLAPVIAWTPAPATIPYGTALGASQLDATATVGGVPVPGAFAYTPAAGTVLGAGTQTLRVTFTPTSAIYSVATATTVITVTQAVPVITWAAPAGLVFGTALSATQLDATVAGVGGAALPGTLVYTPPAGTVLTPGTQTLSVVFTPTDAVDYTTATASVPITIGGFALSSISPAAVLLASADTKITLTGTGFVPTSVVMVNGAAVASTFVGSTTLTAVLPAALLAKAGTLAVTVLDPSLETTTAAQTFTVLPAVTGATLTGPSTTPPGSQPSVTLAVTNPYPLPITATFNLSFVSAGSTAVDDPAIQFSTGGRTYSYTVAANSTTVPPVELQAGTDAGTITITATLTADGVDVTPSGVAPVVIVVPAVVPVISSTTITRSGDALTVVIHGFSNTREVSQAAFNFTAATGDTLATPSVTLPSTTIFGTWYGDAASQAYGSTFTYTQIFNTSSDAATVGQVKVVLTNSVGASLPSTSP